MFVGWRIAFHLINQIIEREFLPDKFQSIEVVLCVSQNPMKLVIDIGGGGVA